MTKNNSQLHVCANILCSRIQMSATGVGRGAVAHGEEAGGWCGAWVTLTLLSDTAPLLGYSSQV